MKQVFIILMTLVICISGLCSCKQTDDNESSEEYNMPYATDAAQYCLFMNKQISVVSNQLSSTIIIGNTVKNGEYPTEDAIASAEQSKNIIASARGEVEKMIPPERYEDSRLNTFRLMNNAEQDIQKYIDELKEKNINTLKIDSLLTVMQTDFTAITAESNSYYE